MRNSLATRLTLEAGFGILCGFVTMAIIKKFG
jgi:hypothetical protein